MAKKSKKVLLSKSSKITYIIFVASLVLGFAVFLLIRFPLYHFFIENNDSVLAFSAPKSVFYFFFSNCFV